MDNKAEAYAMCNTYFKKNKFAYIAKIPVSLFVLLSAGTFWNFSTSRKAGWFYLIITILAIAKK